MRPGMTLLVAAESLRTPELTRPPLQRLRNAEIAARATRLMTLLQPRT